MWSRVLEAHEVTIVSTGCGLAQGDVDIDETSSKLVEKKSVSNGECIPGKGDYIVRHPLKLEYTCLNKTMIIFLRFSSNLPSIWASVNISYHLFVSFAMDEKFPRC